MTARNFEEFIAAELTDLELYTKTIAKVHGPSHPEIIKVREIFQQMTATHSKDANADLSTAFSQLRTITNGYQTPANTCETTEVTYSMLKKADELYHS